jgi:hypothetical protein
MNLKRLALGTLGLILILASMGILTEAGLAPRIRKPFNARYAAVGLPILAIGVWLGRKGFGPALRFRLPKPSA